MGKPIFDIDNGDFLLGANNNIAFNSNGNMMMRMSENMAIDMDTGEIHFVSSWKIDDTNYD